MIAEVFLLFGFEAFVWALVPLIPLLATGLYLFILPHAAKRRDIAG